MFTFTAVWLKYFLTLYLFPNVCTWPDTLRSIYHASWDKTQPVFFYLCSVARSRLCCSIYVWEFCKCCHSRRITTDCSYKATALRCNVRLWWTNSPRLDRWPRNQLFSPHCTTQAHSGMAVITIPASPRWAILHSVEHIANVITLHYTLLWARFNVECVSFESPLPQ